MTRAAEIVDSVFRAIFRPRMVSSLREWMAENIRLRATENPGKVGKYDPDYTPWSAEVLDLFLRSAEWSELIIKKSSQSGFSLSVLGFIVRMVAEFARNFMYVIDSATEAKNISRRLQALIEDSPATRQHYEENEDAFSLLTFQLPGMNGWLTGAGSAGTLANKTAWLAVADEVDKHSHQQVEAPSIDLLRDRLKEQPGSKLVALSTPTVETGQIHREHETGSQHKMFVPCPHCGHLQFLTRHQLRYDHCKDLLPGEDGAPTYDLSRVLVETFIECQSCSKPIEEREKRRMLLGRKYLPTNFRVVKDPDTGEEKKIPNWEPGKMSYQHTDMYSLNPKVTWGHLAVKLITARGKPGKLQAVLNSNFGEVYKEATGAIGESQIMRLRGAYEMGALPIVPAIVCMAVDNQADCKKFVRGGFTHTGDLWVIDYGELDTLHDCLEHSQLPVRCKDRDAYVQRVLVDEGGKDGTSYEVRRFCHNLPGWFPCKGRGRGQSRHLFSWTTSHLQKDGLDETDVLHFDDDAYKHALYIERILRFQPTGEGQETKRQGPVAPRLWIPANASAAFMKELCSERKERREDKTYGGFRMQWVVSGDNDYGDCIKMLLVLWDQIAQHFIRNPAA